MDFTFSHFAAIAGLSGALALFTYSSALRARCRMALAALERSTRSEKQLRERISWFEQMFDGASDMLALHRVEPDGRLIYEYINRSLIDFHKEHLQGAAPEAWIDRDLAEIMRAEFGADESRIEKLLAPYREAIRTGSSTPVANVFRRQAGARVREGVLTPLTDQAGRVVRLVYRGTDLTDRRRSENELRRSAERFASMLAICPVPIIVTRRSDALVRAVSDSWCAATGYAREETVGRRIADLELWGDADSRTSMVDMLLPAGPVRGSKGSLRDKAGKLRTFMYSATPIWWDDEPAILGFPYDVTDIEDARAAAQTAANNFRDLFDLNPLPSAVVSVVGDRLKMVNPAWCAATGWTREEAIGRTSHELGTWTDRPQRSAFIARLRDGKRLNAEPIRFHDRAGTAREFLYSAVLAVIDGEQAYLATRVDVTEIESSRREAQASSDRFEKIFNHTMLPIAITRFADGRILAVNDAWLRLMGHVREEVEGRSARDLDVWVSSAERDRIVEMMVRGDPVSNIRVRHRKRSGEILEIQFSASMIDWMGEPAILGSPFDVSELERTRREAQSASECLQQVFEISPAPLMVGTEEGRFLAVNAAWLDLHGYTREELEGQSSLNLRVWADPTDRPRLFDLLTTGRKVHRVPIRLRKKSGELFEALYSAVRADWNGSPAILASPQDVTEMQRNEAQIRKLNESLEAKVAQRTAELSSANQELEMFSYSVSHDLRAPLRWMQGFGKVLAQRDAVRRDPDALAYANQICAAATRMNEMVEALLRFSRLSRQELSVQTVALGPEVELVIAEFGPVLAGRRVRWIVGDLPAVRADVTLLRLVLQNLVENAIKYTRNCETAVIEVGAARAEGECVVHVKDNGAGFDMQYAGKLFGVFQRLHSDREFEGNGIGLATAQRIVLRHGGRIWAESAPDAGATFRFTLPG